MPECPIKSFPFVMEILSISKHVCIHLRSMYAVDTLWSALSVVLWWYFSHGWLHNSAKHSPRCSPKEAGVARAPRHFLLPACSVTPVRRYLERYFSSCTQKAFTSAWADGHTGPLEPAEWRPLGWHTVVFSKYNPAEIAWIDAFFRSSKHFSCQTSTTCLGSSAWC